MRLNSPDFEKRFRSLFQAQLKASPELRKRYKRDRKPQRADSTNSARSLLLSMVIAAVFGSLTSRIGGVEFGLSIIGLWAAGTALRKAQHFFQTFYGSDDLIVLGLLPLNDQQTFSVLGRKYFRSFGWLFCQLLLLYLVLALVQREVTPILYGAVPLAVLQTLLIAALALHGAVFLHALPLGALGGLLRAAAMIALFAGVYSPTILHYTINFSYWFFPTGWLHYVFVQAAVRSDLVPLGFLIPIGALIYAGIYSWQRLRGFYSLHGFELIPGPGLFGITNETSNRGTTEIQDSIGDRSFLRGVDWDRIGWIERFISRWFQGRDRIVLDFLVADHPRWTDSFRTGLWFWFGGAVIVFAFGSYGGFAVFFPAYLLATVSLPLLGGEWRGLQQFPNSGVFMPGYAVYPITFREIVVTLLKVNIIRTAIAVPFVIGFGMLASWKLGHSPLLGAAVGAKLLTLLIVLQPLMVLLPVSKSTNDTAKMRMIWLFLIIPGVLILIGLSISLFFLTRPLTVIGIYAAILLVSLFLLVIYRSAFRKTKFDIFSKRVSGLEG